MVNGLVFSPFYLLSGGGTSSPDIVDLLQRSNDLQSGIILFIGILVGVVGMVIFWTRFKGE